MEENKLNIDELKQVAGGKGANTKGDPAHITQVTEYFRDKNLYHAKGTFREGTEVYMLGFYKGSRGNCFLVRSKTGNKEGYVPDGTLREGWDD